MFYEMTKHFLRDPFYDLSTVHLPPVGYEIGHILPLLRISKFWVMPFGILLINSSLNCRPPGRLEHDDRKPFELPPR